MSTLEKQLKKVHKELGSPNLSFIVDSTKTIEQLQEHALEMLTDWKNNKENFVEYTVD